MKTYAIRKAKTFISTFLMSLLLCFAAFAFIACSPKDLKYDDAIRLAKKDFGCEKILWIRSGALVLEAEPGDEMSIYSLRSHYAYYVVGEKAGEEIYIVIPSTPQLDEPYIANWGLDYTFMQIVDKFNECGAHYVADVPDDYYGNSRSYIDIVTRGEIINSADLDIPVAFEYRWIEDGYIHYCTVAQENGELKAYKQTEVYE